MSIISAFDNKTEEILKPRSVISKVENFPEIVVVTFNEKIFDLIRKMDNSECIDGMSMGYYIPIYKINYKEKNIAVYHTLLGGAGSAACMEEVIAKGGKKFIFFGSCGTLDKNIVAGHFILPSDAYRDEGTSYLSLRTCRRLY